MAQTGAAEGLEGASFLAILWRRKVAALACVVSLVGLAFVYTSAQPKTYVSSLQVLVQPPLVDPFNYGGQPPDKLVNMDTEAQVLTSAGVADLVRAKLHSTVTTEQLAKDIQVQVPPNTKILDIRFSAHSPAAAEQGVTAVAAAYLDYRSDQVKAQAQKRIADLKVQADALQKQLRSLTEKKSSLPPSDTVGRAYAQAQMTVIVKQLSDVRTAQDELKTMRIDPGSVITPARLPKRASSPSLPVNLAIGLVGGVLLGCGLALAAHRIDPRVHDARSLERDFGLPVLVTVSQRHRVLGRFRRSGTPPEIAYQRLATLLVQRSGELRAQVAMIAAAGSRGTSSPIASRLARALTQSGFEVVLLSLDSSTGEKVGLSDAVAYGTDAAVILDESRQGERLRIVGAGTLALTPAMLNSRRARDVMTKLREAADYVVIDAPALPVGSMAQAMGLHADVVIAVVTLGSTLRNEVTESVHEIAQMPAPLLGVVVTPRANRATRPSTAEPAGQVRLADHLAVVSRYKAGA